MFLQVDRYVQEMDQRLGAFEKELRTRLGDQNQSTQPASPSMGCNLENFLCIYQFLMYLPRNQFILDLGFLLYFSEFWNPFTYICKSKVYNSVESESVEPNSTQAASNAGTSRKKSQKKRALDSES